MGEGEAGTAGAGLGFVVCSEGTNPLEMMERGCTGAGDTITCDWAIRQKPPAAPTAKRGKGAAASTSTSTGAGGADKDKDKDNDGLYHRPGWERFDQWITGKICVSSSSEQMSDEEERRTTTTTTASPAKSHHHTKALR